MNKRGLLGKIFLIILIIILIIGAIIGITAYQAYNFYKTAQQEQEGINQDIKALSEQKDCAKVDSIQTRFLNIKSSADSACKNPIIRIGVQKFMADKPVSISGQNISVSCENLNAIYNEMTNQLNSVRESCSNVSSNKTQQTIQAPPMPTG